MSANHRVVGQRLPRLDGVGKVTGKARYGVDQSLPGMLYGKRGCKLPSAAEKTRIGAIGVCRTRQVGDCVEILDLAPRTDHDAHAAVGRDRNTRAGHARARNFACLRARPR